MSQSPNPGLFQPVGISRTSERVAEAIRKTILAGRLKPGDALPPERTLADQFQVTRNTVREALRALEQSRLVSIRQGSGVRVLDYLASAGLEFLAVLLGPEAEAQPTLLLDLSEARSVLGEAMGRHALDHLDPANLPAITEAVEAFATEALREQPDVGRLQALELEIHNRMIRAGGNQAFILLHNSLQHVYGSIASRWTPLVGQPRVLADRYRRLVAALERRDYVEARRQLADVFAQGHAAMRRASGGRGHP